LKKNLNLTPTPPLGILEMTSDQDSLEIIKENLLWWCVMIVEQNVRFHLFQKRINQCIAMTVLGKTGQEISKMIGILEMIEVQDIPEKIQGNQLLYRVIIVE